MSCIRNSLFWLIYGKEGRRDEKGEGSGGGGDREVSKGWILFSLCVWSLEFVLLVMVSF